MPLLRRRSALLAAPALFAAAPIPVMAQSAWAPTQPVRLINPFAPGGSPDILARAMSPHVSEDLGQPMTVENRAGAGGSVGARFAAQQAPDGHNILLAAISAVLAPHLQRDPGYQVSDFRPVSILTTTPFVLVVRGDFPAQTVQEWHDVVRANPGRFSYASAGPGTPHRMAAELYAQASGAVMTHVSYRGTSPALTDVRAGTVDFMFADLAAALVVLQGEGVRALAVTTRERVPAVADVPTLNETVVPGFEAYSFVSWWVPAATPDAAVARLNQSALTALNKPDVLERIDQFGFQKMGTTVEESTAFIATESEKWGNLIRSRNLTLDV